jgi:hypothetical protein
MTPIALPAPETEIDLIAYQTILPYYHPNLIQEYEKVAKGAGVQILKLLSNEIKFLNKSKSNWEATKTHKEWIHSLGEMGYNITGQYLYKPEDTLYFESGDPETIH